MGHPQGLIPRDVVPKAGPLKERVFDIDDALIEKFLENDVTRVAEIYQRSMVPEILLTQRFGSRDLSDQIARVADEYSVAREAARDNPKKLDKLQREEQKALRDIEAMRDMLLETYARPADPSSFFVKASRAMRTFNYIRMLGGMTISAIPDLARPVMQQGLLRTAKFMMKAALTPKRVRMSMLDARRFGVGVDMVLNTRAAAIADVGEDMGQKMDRYLNRGSQQFSVLSLMAPWNATMKQLSGVMIADSMLADIGRLASGNIAKKRAQKLANSGIDSRMASRIAKQFEKHGDDGTLRLGQSDKWDDIEARQAYESAVLKEVENVIITPGIADKPNFMSSEVGKTLMQFKSFAFASANRIAISGLQQRDMAQLNGLMLSVFLGGVVYATKQYASGRPITDNPTTFLNNAIDRSGVTGYLWDIKNVYEKMSGNVLFGDQQVSRYQSRNAVGALLGPSLGTAEDLQGVFRAMHEEQPNRSDVRAARRLVPYQNLFYTQKLFDALEESAAQAVDAQ